MCPAGLSRCALDDGDFPREEVRRLKVELEASKTRHMQELKAKNDYVRKSHQLRRGGVGRGGMERGGVGRGGIERGGWGEVEWRGERRGEVE